MGKLLKSLIGVVVGLAAIALLVLIVVASRLDRIIERAVETYGPEATGTSVTLDGVDVSIWSGEGSLKGLVIDNPDGYESDYAISLNRIDIAIDIESLTGDVIVIKEIVVDGASLIIEQRGITDNNLQTILGNVQRYSGPDQETEESESSDYRYVVKTFRFTNGKLGALSKAAGLDEQVAIPDVVVTGVGEKSGGATIAEVSKQLITPVIRKALAAVQNLAIEEVEERIKQELEEELEEELQNKLKGILGGKDD